MVVVRTHATNATKEKLSYSEVIKLGSLNGQETSFGISWGSPVHSRQQPVPGEKPACRTRCDLWER